MSVIASMVGGSLTASISTMTVSFTIALVGFFAVKIILVLPNASGTKCRDARFSLIVTSIRFESPIVTLNSSSPSISVKRLSKLPSVVSGESSYSVTSANGISAVGKSSTDKTVKTKLIVSLYNSSVFISDVDRNTVVVPCQFFSGIISKLS